MFEGEKYEDEFSCIVVFWIMTPSCLVDYYQPYGERIHHFHDNVLSTFFITPQIVRGFVPRRPQAVIIFAKWKAKISCVGVFSLSVAT
jgi:hypothetical protein